MKALAAKTALCLLVEVCVFAAMGYWWSSSHIGDPVVVLLMWPSVLLAMAGAIHTWLLSAFLVLALPVVAATGLRKHSWNLQLGSSATLAAAYCLVGLLTFRLLWSQPAAIPAPPSNPYSADAARAQEYASTYREGYHSALTGTLSTYCFRPEAPTRGFYTGQQDGHKVLGRVFQRAEDRGERVIRSWAAIDGVTLAPAATTNQLKEPKATEPTGAAR